MIKCKKNRTITYPRSPVLRIFDSSDKHKKGDATLIGCIPHFTHNNKNDIFYNGIRRRTAPLVAERALRRRSFLGFRPFP